MARKATLSINIIGVDEEILKDKYEEHKDAYYYLAGVMSKNTFDQFDEGGFRLTEKKVSIAHFIIRCRTDEKAIEELKTVGKLEDMEQALYGDYKDKPSDPVVVGKVLTTAASISKALSNGLFDRLGEELVRNKTTDVISLTIITESPVVDSMITRIKHFDNTTEVVADRSHPLTVILENASAAHAVKAMEKMHKSIEIRLAFQVSEPLSKDVFEQIEVSNSDAEVAAEEKVDETETWIEYTDDLYYM